MTSSYTPAKLGAITIAAAGTTSRWVSFNEYSDAASIGIQSPATLDAGTYTFEVSYDGSTSATLTDASGNVSPPSAQSARMYTDLCAFPYFRIKGPAAAADRTFIATKHWTV
jgi:hypothetical protein